MKALFFAVLALTACASPGPGAVQELRDQLAALERPASVLSDPAFQAWKADPELRSALREGLRELAVAEPLRLVTADEPGEPLLLEARLVDETDGRPIAGALVEIVHADASGKYFPESDGPWNPRLFGCVRTSEEGALFVATIRPGAYEEDEGRLGVAHLHFNAEAEGYRPYGGELLLGDDPAWTLESRTEAQSWGALIVEPYRGASGTWRLRATIPLQPTS